MLQLLFPVILSICPRGDSPAELLCLSSPKPELGEQSSTLGSQLVEVVFYLLWLNHLLPVVK